MFIPKYSSRTTQLLKVYSPRLTGHLYGMITTTASLTTFSIRHTTLLKQKQNSSTLPSGLLALTRTTEIGGASETQSTFSSSMRSTPSSWTTMSLNFWAHRRWQSVELHCSHSYWCERREWVPLQVVQQPLFEFIVVLEFAFAFTNTSLSFSHS